MAVIFVDEHGACVRYSGGRIVVTDKDDGELASVRVQEVEAVIVFVHASVTSAALSALLQAGVDTVYLDHTGRYLGRTQGALARNLGLRLAQYEAVKDEAFCLGIGRKIVSAKLTNMRTVLLRYARHRDDPAVAANAQRILQSVSAVAAAQTAEAVLGLEGTGTREYFSGFSAVVLPPFTFQGRKRRPPPDPVNAMLGFAYAILGGLVGSAVYAAGLDPFLGVYHRDSYGRESLVLDLMEEFRPVIADSVVLTCCNKKMLDPERDFEERNGGVYLNESGRARFFTAFHARMRETVQVEPGSPAVPYGKVLYAQARKLARCIQERTADYEPFTVR